MKPPKPTKPRPATVVTTRTSGWDGSDPRTGFQVSAGGGLGSQSQLGRTWAELAVSADTEGPGAGGAAPASFPLTRALVAKLESWVLCKEIWGTWGLPCGRARSCLMGGRGVSAEDVVSGLWVGGGNTPQLGSGHRPLMGTPFFFQVPEVRKKFTPNPSAIFQASAPRILNV